LASHKRRKIAGGAVRVTFKLLSPAQRPVQITRDLAGFWQGSYADGASICADATPSLLAGEIPSKLRRRATCGPRKT